MALRRPRLPLISARPEDLVLLPAGQRLWRVHFASSQHASPWNRFRRYGPIDARFDHHLADAYGQPIAQERGILYAANDAPAAIAEVFQNRRVINRRLREPRLVSFELTRSATLLDLRSLWPTRAGASQELATGSRRIAREWSRAIYDQYLQVEGLCYPTKMHGQAFSIALYERCEDAMPLLSLLNRALADRAIRDLMLQVSADLNYRLL